MSLSFFSFIFSCLKEDTSEILFPFLCLFSLIWKISNFFISDIFGKTNEFLFSAIVNSYYNKLTIFFKLFIVVKVITFNNISRS